MPLNPNGKIDKPALPFPDTVHAVSSAPAAPGKQISPMEQTMSTIWANLLPNPPQPIPVDESFFDLGGHSILATRLIFEIRKTFVIDAPLGLIFDKPTVSELVQAVEDLRNSDLNLTFKNTEPAAGATDQLTVPGVKPTSVVRHAVEYSSDYLELLPKLQKSYPSLPADYGDKLLTVFLTGATGFLGAFILRSLLSQANVKKVICLVRAADDAKALERLKEAATDRGLWNESWISQQRLEVLAGDLGLDHFGLGAKWDVVAEAVDAVLHNGAFVSITPCVRCLAAADLWALAGALGVPVRKASPGKCNFYLDSDRAGFLEETKAVGLRLLDVGHRHRSLCSSL
jgi:L-2-aminoadipate reductase